MPRALWPLIAATLIALPLAAHASGTERCGERRIVRFGETTETIAQRCGVTPGAIERRNPGIHIDGARLGTQVNVPRPTLPSPTVRIGGNPAISGGSRIAVPGLR